MAKKKKSSAFAVVQQIGKSFFLPVSVLPIAGILLGLGSSFTNADTIAAYHLQGIMGEGTILNALLTIMSQVGNTIFGNLPLIFALAVALGMAKNEKAVAVLSAGISFFVMNSTINAMLKLSGKILADGTYAKSVLNGQITSVCGIDSLQMGVFAGVIVGLVTAALTSFLTGITEPIEFTFLFIAPGLFILHCGLAGLSFALMHILKICIGTTFSCGLIDFMLYGVLQGQTKSNWMMILPVFAVYAVLYYFVFKFVIEKFDLPTPGRDDDEEEVKLYTKADYQAKKGAANEDTDAPEDPISFMILKGLGGIKNIEDIDCCATRLRITVTDETKVTDQYLKQSGSKGIIKKGTGIQIIYGPQVSVIKSNFEEYVEYYAQHGTDPSKEEEVTPIVSSKEEEKKEIRHGKLVAVATGKVLAMTQAKDEAFATCAMGDGVVIEPEKGVVVAPADGKITALMKPSLHAIGIETKEGLNLLIHIGIDTVKLDGKGFKDFVKSGQEVKAGDKLVEFDIDLIKKEGYSPDIMVVVLEDSNLPKVAYKTGEKTVAGKTVVAEF